MQEHLPGHEEQPEEIICPSCGRFVGALPKCPHCGARIATRLSVRIFRYGAILLATVGLALLYLMARHREVPVIEIGSIKPTMNFAYIRVAGHVTEDTRVISEGDLVRSVRFTVDDGTGEIPVTAYREQGAELVRREQLPGIGDYIEVAGSLSVSSERILLRLQAAEQLSIQRAEVEELPLDEVTEEILHRSILVRGTIAAVRPPRAGSRRPWTIVLEDGTGKRDISFWQDTYDQLEDKVRLAPGSRVQARVSVGSFSGRLQLRLASVDDLVFTDAPQVTKDTPDEKPKKRASPGTPLVKVTPDRAGQYAKVTGTVKSITPPQQERAPYQVIIHDGVTELPVVYWDSVADQLGTNTPVVGAQWQATGRINVYSNRVQVKVNQARRVRLLELPDNP